MAFLAPKILMLLTACAVIASTGQHIQRRGHRSLSYESKDPQDPENVSLVRQALTAQGINPNGITVTAFYKKVRRKIRHPKKKTQLVLVPSRIASGGTSVF